MRHRGYSLRFSLRTLLLISTLICALSAYVGYEYKWVRARRAHLANHTLSAPGMIKSLPGGYFRPYRGEPLLLWAFAEPKIMELGIWIDERDVKWNQGQGRIASNNATLVRATRLFPEAHIFAFCKNGRSARTVVIVDVEPIN